MKFKYTVGEKVLCFEPDETKARVLYNAKIMDADILKDIKGRKYVEYKIHFQGWNHAWDRWADESFVLKDNEQNRKMQRKLAKKAIRKLKLQKGKKRHHLPGVASKQEGDEENIIDSSSGESYDSYFAATDSKEKPCNFDNEGPPDKKARLNIFGGFSQENLVEEDSSSKDDYHLRRVVSLDIPASLQERLEEDHTMMKKRDMLVNLPIRPNAIQILENYVKRFAIQSLSGAEKQKFTTVSSQPFGHDILPPEKRLSLCQEICSDLKLLFDYALPLSLLYIPERDQYKDLIKHSRLCGPDRQRVVGDCNSKEEICLTSSQMDMEDQSTYRSEVKVATTKEERLPLSDMKDLSQEPDSVLIASESAQIDVSVIATTLSEQESTSESAFHGASLEPTKTLNKKKNAEAQLIEETHKYLIPNQPNLDQTGLSKDSRGRRRSSRLSHIDSCSPQKSNSNDEISLISDAIELREESYDTSNTQGGKSIRKYTISIDPCVFLRMTTRQNRHCAPSSAPGVPSCSNTIVRPSLFNATPCMDREQYLSIGGSSIKNIKELQKAWDWCIIPNTYQPEDGTNLPPSLIYGIHHLLRLFVKLPDILLKMEIPEFKLKILIKHLNRLLKFLSEYERELYETDAYVAVSSM